jgi:hypothetical protein
MGVPIPLLSSTGLQHQYGDRSSTVRLFHVSRCAWSPPGVESSCIPCGEVRYRGGGSRPLQRSCKDRSAQHTGPLAVLQRGSGYPGSAGWDWHRPAASYISRLYFVTPSVSRMCLVLPGTWDDAARSVQFEGGTSDRLPGSQSLLKICVRDVDRFRASMPAGGMLV